MLEKYVNRSANLPLELLPPNVKKGVSGHLSYNIQHSLALRGVAKQHRQAGRLHAVCARCWHWFELSTWEMPRGGNWRYKMHIVKSLTELFNRHVGFACGVCQCLGPPASRQVALQKCEKATQRGAATWGFVQSCRTAAHCHSLLHDIKKKMYKFYFCLIALIFIILLIDIISDMILHFIFEKCFFFISFAMIKKRAKNYFFVIMALLFA